MYSRYRQSSQGCDLCKYKAEDDETVESHQGWLVITNRFPYKQWDWRPVRSHLMIIPTRHITKLSELNDKEWQQFSQIASRYDSQGYSTYLRSPLNELKTVAHLHWHLIQTK